MISTASSCRFFGDGNHEAESLSEEEERGEDSSAKKTPHPPHATAWDTEAFLLSHSLPPSESVQICRTEMENAGKGVTSEKALIDARDALFLKVKENASLYHFCFYIITHKLSQDLVKSKDRLKEKSLLFLSGIQNLWILARALDRLENSETYFQYLRQRYIQISQSEFGRQLSVIGRSLDLLPRPDWNQKKSVIKGQEGIEGAFGTEAEESSETEKYEEVNSLEAEP